MAIDLLQNKIRKLKNPSVVGFALDGGLIPPEAGEGRSLCEGYGVFCRELLEALKGTVPAVRFSMGSFVMAGCEGIALLQDLLGYAREMDYYVILDLPELFSVDQAELTAAHLRDENTSWKCDGFVVGAYLGTDVLKPLAAVCEKQEKDMFVLLRSGNKSAPELQDLITGGRLVHLALADRVNRMGLSLTGKHGYSRIAAVAAASSADASRNLRAKYKQLFLLLDGYDYPNANAKNCAAAFDNLGHGAAACAFCGITGAWRDTREVPYPQTVLQAAQRMRKNLTGYVTIL